MKKSDVTPFILPISVDEDNKQDIIRRVEEILVKAKAGEIRNMVICYNRTDEPTKWYNQASRGLDFPTMIGWLELCFLEWKNNYLAYYEKDKK